MGYSGNWVCKVIISNHTPYKLSVLTSRLAWGYWYRDDVDDRGPSEVAPGDSGIALAVRAAAGSSTGYECTCTWKFSAAEGMKKADVPIGSMDLAINVPYSKGNKSSLNASGFLRTASWADLPKDGHEFTRTIDVYEIS